MKKLLFVLLFIFSSSYLISQNIEGNWNGMLDVGIAKLRLVVNVQKEGIDYVGTLDSPDQGAKGIPITKTAYPFRSS